MIGRRKVLFGLIAAPAIVRVSALMPISSRALALPPGDYSGQILSVDLEAIESRVIVQFLGEPGQRRTFSARTLPFSLAKPFRSPR